VLEVRETNYWLRLLRDGEILNKQHSQNLIDESEELIKILTSIVKTGYGIVKTGYGKITDN